MMEPSQQRKEDVSEDYLSYLRENIPTWLASLVSIAAATDKSHEQQQQKERHRVSEPKSKEGCLRLARRHLQWRERQGPSAMKSAITATPTKKRSFTGSKPSAQELHSGSSSQFSGVDPYRARNAVSVVYDSATQVALERLVEQMNTARRMLIEAKEQLLKEATNSRLLDSLKQSQSMMAVENEDEDSTEDMFKPGRRESLDKEFMMAQMRRQRKGRQPAAGITSSRSHPTLISTAEKTKDRNKERIEKLETMEECLQHAQDICTIAAYQMLRDGQCSWETKATSEQLSEVWMAILEEGDSVSSQEVRRKSSTSFLSRANDRITLPPNTSTCEPGTDKTIILHHRTLSASSPDEDQSPTYCPLLNSQAPFPKAPARAPTQPQVRFADSYDFDKLQQFHVQVVSRDADADGDDMVAPHELPASDLPSSPQ